MLRVLYLGQRDFFPSNIFGYSIVGKKIRFPSCWLPHLFVGRKFMLLMIITPKNPTHCVDGFPYTEAELIMIYYLYFK